MMTIDNRVIFALDVDNRDRALDLVARLRGHVAAFKVGLELFIEGGPGLVKEIVAQSPVMLDLKLHDIPETVERAILRAGNLGVKFCTLHAQQRDTIIRAVRAADKVGIQLLGVMVLTSLSYSDLWELRMPGCYDSYEPKERIAHLSSLLSNYGLNGFVCSPEEVNQVRRAFPKAVLVTPGIRPAGVENNDQKRVGTPAQAVHNGANYIVVGRPIRDADDPVAAADAIAAEANA